MSTTVLWRWALALMLLWVPVTSLALAQSPDGTAGAEPAAPIPTPQTVATAFTYQGRLLHNNAPINATCDFEFRLFPARAGGSQVGATLPVQATVKDGLFSARLDFGSAAFSGKERWLEISVTCPAAGPSGVLGPRQELTATPYALGLRPGATITDAASTVQLNRAWTNSPDGPVYQAALHAAVIGGAASFNYGVYGSAATAGVYGYSADASGRGVHGQAAATSGAAYGVVGISASPDGAGVYARGAGEQAPDLVLGGSSTSNDNGVIVSDMAYPGSDLFLRSNDNMGIHLDRNGDEAGNFYLYRDNGSAILHLDEEGSLSLQDRAGKALFAVSATAGAQLNTGAAALQVNTIPILRNRPRRGAEDTVTMLDISVPAENHFIGHGDSITIGADGLGLVAWVGPEDRIAFLKIAHCDNVACSSATVTTLDAIGPASYPELTVGADGLGLMCYRDDVRLRVLHCDNLRCTSATFSSYGPILGVCDIVIG